jgi:2-methylisocitrate lyase-like PEP mutase family enzyme
LGSLACGAAELHRPGAPFVLPNAWDIGSARALAAAGFPAIGTTSLGIAASHGLLDATGSTRDFTVDLARSLVTARLSCPVTCDVEDGFSSDPTRVAELVSALGVDGVNIEDASAGALVDPGHHAAKIAAIKRAAPAVFVNARTDTFWLGKGDLQETMARLRRYVRAGADGVFVPGDLDESTIEAITRAIDAPLNVLASPQLTRTELANLGVARISTGSLLYRAALSQAVTAACAVRDGAALPTAVSYDEVQTMNGSSDTLQGGED